MLSVVLCLVSASPAFAQNRGWINLDFISATSNQDAQTFTLQTPVDGETASASASYPKMPRATGVLVGGGFGATSLIGFGINFDFENYEYPVGMAINIPHPLFFNRFASDVAVTSESLQRKDRGVDFEVVLSPTPSGPVSVRVFGGPTYFHVSQEMVQDIGFNQQIDLFGGNSVQITSHRDQEISGSSWGFNVGGDVGYFFTDHVGVGGEVRYNRGTVTIDNEPLSGESAELTMGHATVGGGLRLRF
ncbi:MAG TPA: hypothetical protein VL173_11690 [Vicinamibacterales bacterium]|nr:hypothetical protein [Vicinamibacterales bacterium]